MSHRCLSIAGLVLLAAPTAAFAVDSDTFEPSGSAFDARGSLQLHQPEIGFKNAMYAGLGLAWTDDPIVIEHGDGTEEPYVHALVGTRLAGGYDIAGRARLELGVPFYPYAGAPDADWSGATIGDIGLGALVPILAPRSSTPGLAAHASLRLPTGGDYTGAAGAQFALAAVAGGHSDRLGWNANLGLELGGSEELGTLDLGSSLDPGLGLNLRVADAMVVGAEVTSKLTLAGGLGPFNKNPTEGHLYAQYGGKKGIALTAGAGTGLVAGVGAPDVRLFLLVSYHTAGVPPVYDQDADGILDEADACPLEAEDVDSFQDEDGCPDLDNDQDGIPDDKDQCARQPEDMDSFNDADGCPDPDNDGDRVLDTEDECPTEAGTIATRGCPDADGDEVVDSLDMCISEPGPANTRGCPDADGDRVPDKADACPAEPADPRIDPARSNGCPSKVVVGRNRIEILEKIQFDNNKSKVKKVSFELLDEIAKVLLDNPDIRAVEVAGHTDNTGSEAANMSLSQARAEAVMLYLAQHGVDPNRLVAKGYGPTRPLADNSTDEGKATNRRVEFIILEQ
ncbi:MAG: OmpA family protein [Pseudomonadota bacterium]